MKCLLCKKEFYSTHGKTKYCAFHRDQKVRKRHIRDIYLKCIRKINFMDIEDNPVKVGRELRQYYFNNVGKYPVI